MREDHTPVLVGAGQFTQRDVDPRQAKDPMGMMVECARMAAADAGLLPRALADVDTLAVVNIFGWHYANAPGLLAERLGAQPARCLYTTVGGNTPQWLVNEMADAIAAGRARRVLLAGAEAINTLVRARRAGIHLDWSAGGSGSPTVVGDNRPGTTDHEIAHGLQLPTTVYPLFETALRAHYGLDPETHRARLGWLCSQMSAVAAENPYAWFRTARSAAELTTITADNRFIGYPYPKYMNAIIDVDQGAAVLMTSVAEARALGIPESRWVYLWGGADAHDLWFVSERRDYHSSPALRRVGERALEMAGVEIGQIAAFDLYSCFPVAVQIARDMLGVAADDPRPFTVTGGLPYHGGPGNNYSLHAIATIMERLRAQPGTTGMVTALGWYLTKHSAGIYGTRPPHNGAWPRKDGSRDQAELDAMPHPALELEARGPGTIEAYTVLHDRDATPIRGIVIGRLADGRRFLANTPSDRVVLEELMVREAVGVSGHVFSADGQNCFDPRGA
jgi:acetyl-CoA C-acetyltransferase